MPFRLITEGSSVLGGVDGWSGSYVLMVFAMNVGLREYRNIGRVLFALFTFAVFGTGWSATGECVADFSASAGIVSSPFVLTNGYVFQPIQTSATNGGRAVYSFALAQPGQFVIQAAVDAPSSGANSMLVNIDSEPTTPEMAWRIPVTRGFTNLTVTTTAGSPRLFTLGAGSHRVIIRGTESNVQFSHVYIHSAVRPAPPTGLRIVAGP